MGRATFKEVATTGNLPAERQRFLDVLAGRQGGACEDFACVNAAAILKVTGRVTTLQEGLAASRQCVASGAALAKLEEWICSQKSSTTRICSVVQN